MKNFNKINPKKRFGQNFLEDQILLDELANLMRIENYDRFVEIGPGTGNLTQLIVDRSDFCTSIEIDKNLISLLEKKFIKKNNFKLINESILNFKLSSITKKRKSIRLAGNLPYNLSSPILEWCIQNSEFIIDMHFMLQKEFAERCVGDEHSKSYGKLSVICDYLFEVQVLKNVDKSFFKPPPKVDSSFVKFKPKKEFLDQDEFTNLKKILNYLFSAKRKKIKKTLAKIFNENEIQKINLDFDLRPDQLNTQNFLELSKLLNDHG